VVRSNHTYQHSFTNDYGKKARQQGTWELSGSGLTLRSLDHSEALRNHQAYDPDSDHADDKKTSVEAFLGDTRLVLSAQSDAYFSKDLFAKIKR